MQVHREAREDVVGRAVAWLRAPISRPSTSLFLALAIAYAVVISVAQLVKYRGYYENSLFTLDYGFGSLLRNLAEGKGYVVEMHGIPFVTHRLPLVPVLLDGLSALLGDFSRVWIAKNVLCFLLSFESAALLIRERKPPRLVVALVLVACLLTPMSAFFLSALDNEEAYLGHLVPAGFAILLLRPSVGRWAALAAVCGLIVLTKSSSFGVALALGVLALVKAKDAKGFAWIPLSGALAAMVGWGVYSQARTGHFAVGPTASSFNGLNLHKGNSTEAIAMYPQRNLDEILYSTMAPPAGSVRTEWDVDRFHRRESARFVREQPEAFWELVGRRMGVAFLEIRKIGLSGPEQPGWDRGMVALRPFLLFALGLALGRSIRAGVLGRLGPARVDLAYLALLVSYLAPFLVGFIYYRHLVPVAALSGVFLLGRPWEPKTS